MVARGNHVHAAISDHHRASRGDPVVRQQVREEIALVLARAVELATVHGLEVRVEREVADDPLGVDARSGGPMAKASWSSGGGLRPRRSSA